MTIKQQLTDDLSLFYNEDEFSEQVDYLTADEVSITDIIVNFVELDHLQNTPRKTKGFAHCHVQLSDVSEPGPGDEITRGGVVWRVERVFRKEFGAASLEVRKDPRSKFS